MYTPNKNFDHQVIGWFKIKIFHSIMAHPPSSVVVDTTNKLEVEHYSKYIDLKIQRFASGRLSAGRLSAGRLSVHLYTDLDWETVVANNTNLTDLFSNDFSGQKDRTLSSNDRRVQCSNASQKSKLYGNSSNHVMPTTHVTPLTSGCCVKNDGKLSASVSPFLSSQSPSSSSSSSTSLPMSSSLLSANRKSVRFADDNDDRKFVTLDDSKNTELCKRERERIQNGVDQPLPLCSNSHSNRPEGSDVIGKIPTYAHQYPTHVGMTTFLPDDGSLV